MRNWAAFVEARLDNRTRRTSADTAQYDLPLLVLSYRDLYGWSMDEIVAEIGRTNNCTFCGVVRPVCRQGCRRWTDDDHAPQFRRQALDRGAAKLNADIIATGHNADDVAETVIMNMLRGDVARLRRCTAITTEGALAESGNKDATGMRLPPRCKPLKYAYEKEIVLYAHYKKLDYFATECPHSTNAYRGHARTFLKNLERIRPTAIVDVIRAGERMVFEETRTKPQVAGTCERCGYLSSNSVCKACTMLYGLEKGLSTVEISKLKRTPHTAAKRNMDF